MKWTARAWQMNNGANIREKKRNWWRKHQGRHMKMVQTLWRQKKKPVADGGKKKKLGCANTNGRQK